MSKDVLCPTCQQYPLVGPKDGRFGMYYACDGYRQTGGRLKCGFINQKQYEKLEAGGTVAPREQTAKSWFGGPYNPKPLFQPYDYRHVAASKRRTAEQIDIISHVRAMVQDRIAQQRLLLVEALAGVGKTSTLVEASVDLPHTLSVIAIVYNKRNQVDMAEKFPGNTATITINALGHRIIQKAFGRCRDMNPDKTMQMIEAEWGKENLKDQEYFLSALRADDIVSKCKLTLVSAADAAADDVLDEIVSFYTIDMDGVDINLCYTMVRHVLARYSTKDAILKFGIDYDDQVNLPVVLNLPVEQFDLAYVDEAQDINNARRALVLRVAKRIVVVGDRHQSIYGFAGANTASLDAFKEDVPNHAVLPLSINWRCGRHIIETAQCIVPEIKAGLTHDGEILTLAEERAPEAMRPGDMGLCRTNAPLISLAYGFIKADVPVCILGRDIGKNLRELVMRLARKGKGKLAREFVSIPELLDRLEEYRDAEAGKIKPGKRAQERLQQLEDKVSSIKALCEGMTSIGNGTETDDNRTVLGRITMLFQEDSKRGQIVLCTIHKSKGLEARRVFIFKTELLPFPYAQSEWQIEQEYNLMYVAVTRAMETLVFCGPIPAKFAAIAHLVKPYVLTTDDEMIED